jgi:hypothetical protein
MNTKLPIICVCEPYDSPVMGIFRHFGYKQYELKDGEAIRLGLMVEDDKWERFRESYYLIYKGKRPSIKKLKIFYVVNNIDY